MKKLWTLFVATVALSAGFAAATDYARAETKKPIAEVVEHSNASGSGAPRLSAPDNDGAAILANNSLVSLNHANLTGNYSVLRDLAAPNFQKLNSAKRLAATFSDIRSSGLNLSSIVLYQPKFAGPPAIDSSGFLRMNGFYDTRPLQVHFNLVFAPVAAAWRLMEISVWTAVLR